MTDDSKASDVVDPSDAHGLRPERAMDAATLKAFAHPLRMAMYQALSDDGPATATQLGRRLGESSGQTSYHLRQLERHGLVEDDPEHSGGRERWWRSVGFRLDDRTFLDRPDTAAAVGLVMRSFTDTSGDALRRWVTTPEPDPAWLDVGLSNRATVPMTAAELSALSDELGALVERHTAAARARREAGEVDGRRRVRVEVLAFPLVVDSPPVVDSPEAAGAGG